MRDPRTAPPELLREFRFFAGLDEGQLEAVAAISWIEQLDENSIVLREGDPADTLRLIQTGRVTVSIGVPGRPESVLSTLSRGELLGFSALLPDRRWTASARALKACTLLALPGPALIALCERDQGIGYRLMRNGLEAIANELNDARLLLLDMFGHRPDALA